MKKFLRLIILLLVCFMFENSFAYANTPADYIPHRIKVIFDEDFSSENPPKHFSITLPEDYIVNETKYIEKDTKMYFDTVKVSNEKRGKLNATVTAKATKIYIPGNESIIEVSNPNAIVRFSKYKPADYGSKAVDAGIFVANQFVSNITYPAHFVKGAIQNKEDNRLRSGLKETFDSSIFSYIKKGEPLIINKGEFATLTYFTKNIKNDEDTENREE